MVAGCGIGAAVSSLPGGVRVTKTLKRRCIGPPVPAARSPRRYYLAVFVVFLALADLVAFLALGAFVASSAAAGTQAPIISL